MVVYIYGLRHPTTGLYGYAGQSARPQFRLTQHLAQAHSAGLREWIGGLVADGLTPELCVLEECPDEDADLREGEWIARLREEGNPLVNVVGQRRRRSQRMPAREWQTVSFRLNRKDLQALRFLAKKWDRSISSTMRFLIREAGQREGLPGL